MLIMMGKILVLLIFQKTKLLIFKFKLYTVLMILLLVHRCIVKTKKIMILDVLMCIYEKKNILTNWNL